MKICFRKSGGFAGLVKGCELDCGALEKPQAEELERLARESGISGVSRSHSDAGRDLQHYDITIEHDDQISRLSCDDACVPSAVRPLLTWLKQHARPRPLT